MQKHDVTYLPAAEDDLNEIVDYLLEYSINAANDFIDGLDKLEERLSKFPESCPLSKDKRFRRKGYRIAVLGDYLLFYVLRSEKVFIMRIIHGKRDYLDLLV